MPARRPYRLAGVIVLSAALVHAQAPAGPRHIRCHEDARGVFEDLLARSPTARGLADVVERSDLVVYVRHSWFTSLTLRGRIACVAADADHRVIVIEISSLLHGSEQQVSLGHELQHAVEIAGAPSVCDADSIARLYTRIGEMTGTIGSYESFETRAAVNTGDRIRQELAAGGVSSLPAGPERH